MMSMFSTRGPTANRLGLAAVLFMVVTSVASLFTARADAPPCRYALTAGTATDASTGLTWQRAVSSPPQSWSDATAYCGSLMLEGGGWRTPTIYELQTIVDESEHDPAIDVKSFPSTPSEYFWSSTEAASNPFDAWVVAFFDGSAFPFDTASPSGRVRCVR